MKRNGKILKINNLNIQHLIDIQVIIQFERKPNVVCRLATNRLQPLKVS